MKITELLGAGMLLRAGARASQQLSQTMLASLSAAANERVRPDVETAEAIREGTHVGQALCRLPVHAAMELFMEFAEEQMTEWRRTAAHTRPDGTAVATYSGRFTPRVTLQARSYWGRIVQNEHVRRGVGGYRIQARVPYRYRASFELQASGAGQTLVTFRTTEAVDPDLSCGYDLVRHFEAPSMPAGFGRIGERFLATLPR